MLFSPRFGFNYDVGGEQKTQIRGGTGIFTGRPAYVWISNQSAIPRDYRLIQADTTFAYPFNPDPTTYKPTATGLPPASFRLALTDPGFKFPQLWRNQSRHRSAAAVGIDGNSGVPLFQGRQRIAYINANLPAPQSAFTGPDGRPRWTSNKIYGNVPTPSC